MLREVAHTFKRRRDAQRRDDGAQVKPNGLLLRDEQHTALVDGLFEIIELGVLGDHRLSELDVFCEQRVGSVGDGGQH